MPKKARHLTIKEIITGQDITNQDLLRKELRKRGFAVTQATLSRDLHELGVSRAAMNAGSKYVLPEDSPRPNVRLLTGREIVSVRHNGHLIVIITLPGCANAVGQYVDQQNNPDILGTLAGDNTLLVIPGSTGNIEKLVSYLKTLLTT
jgi:transcriptional regulator of arginine metabolism